MDTELAEQVAYYRAIANEYEDHAIDPTGGDELREAVIDFAADGDVLELACGFGAWTELLLQSAETLTAIDSAPEMIARAANHVAGRQQVRFINADIFDWSPDRQYDCVFFGFLLSHVPERHFDAFWSLIVRCLRPSGRVLFVDDNHRSVAEQTHGTNSELVERRLNDGTAFNVVKVAHEPARLQTRLKDLGWEITVTGAGNHFYWGQGTRR